MAEEEQLGLREVLDIAQTALEEGRYQEATVACRHVLRDYPDSVTAMRLLGESYLEAGRADEAGRAFDKVLAIDPFNVLARVGLGVLAEDRGEDERAIGQFRLAWESAPALPQLRSELVRLYRKRYGVGGRLRMTRIALANLHARNEDLPRAIRQFQVLHQEEPARLDVTVGLAQALWQHGDDEDAAALCRAILAERPRVARAMLMLAAIGGDGGPATGQRPDELLTGVRAFDPDAILAGELVALRQSATLQRFIDAPAAMTPFDPSVLEVAGTDELLGSRTSTLGEESFRWEDIAGGLTSETSLKRDDEGMAGAALPPMPGTEDDVEALFAAIDRQLSTVNVDEEAPMFVAPSDEEIDQVVATVGDTGLLPGWAEPEDDEMAPAPDEPTAVERLTANWDNIDNELAAARPSDDAPLGVTGMLSALGDLEVDLKPFDVDSDAEPDFEETLTFDPSKFSLPPLDGEDDDDLPLDLDAEELGEEVAPFSLDETGPKVKTGGLTFADLVRNGQNDPASYAAANSYADDILEDAPVGGFASIFATRELSPLPDDHLIDVQAASDIASPLDLPEVAPFSFAPPPAPSARPAPVAPVAPPAPVAESAPSSPRAPEIPEAPSRVPAPDFSFDALLRTDAPVLELPGETYYPDATRPLLSSDTTLLPDEEALFASPVPTGLNGGAVAADDDAAGMDNLFSRLRHRKQERIETGDLQVNRRLKSSPPKLDFPEAAPEAAAPPAAEAAPVEAARAAPVEPPAADAPFTPVNPETAGLDDWIMSLVPTDLEAPAPLASPGPDEVVAVSGDDWLAGLVEDGANEAPSWEAPAERPALSYGTNGSAGNGEIDLGAWGYAPSEERPASASEARADRDEMPDQPVADWAESAPEQPMPFASWQAPEPVAASDQPSWADEVPELSAEPEDRLVSRANGHHAEAVAPPAAPAPPPVAIPVVPPPAPAPERPRATAQRQTEQLVMLESMVAADPQNHFARLTLAVAYSASQPEQALNEYRRLIKASDELLPEVIERLKEMIADGDAPSRAHRVLGDAYMKIGQFDMAMGEFQRALSSRPVASKV